MKNNEKRNFRLKMHLVCGTDELRPAMTNVCFEDGYMIATNAHIIIKAKVSLFSNFTDDEVEILNGKFLCADTFKKVIACKHVMITDSGIVDLATKAVYVFADNVEKYPNYNAVLKFESKLEIDCIGLNPKTCKNLFSILNTSDFESLVFNFYGKNKGIKVSHAHYLDNDFIAILMPTMMG